jgi:hypothetical protein
MAIRKYVMIDLAYLKGVLAQLRKTQEAMERGQHPRAEEHQKLIDQLQAKIDEFAYSDDGV